MYQFLQKDLYESTIIDKTQAEDLIKLCEFPAEQKFMLLHRVTDDGFDDFHKRCDGIKNTLTIIKTSKNYIFGGYTGAPWNCNNGYIEDTNSFIFSLKNCEDTPFKANCTDNETSIYGGSEFGPSFGTKDIQLVKCFPDCLNGTSSMGVSYENPLSKSKSILAGSKSFRTTEIEVYKLLE